MKGMTLLHLTTTGRKSGKKHRVELYGFRHDGDMVVIGSYGGQPNDPDWFTNLREVEDVTVEVGKQSYAAKAKVAGGELRKTLWAELGKLNDLYEGYQRKTEREIPMAVLHPVEKP
jgi:deazaflavin-dependent oxidoreductase (nitroreductase family)